MSILTRTKKLYLIDDLCAAHDSLIAQLDALKPTLNPDPGSPFFSAAFELSNVAIKATASAIGDRYKWVDWYVIANDCGRNGREAGYTAYQLKPIRTAEDLLDLIESEDE